jgi:hypothetical protein
MAKAAPNKSTLLLGPSTGAMKVALAATSTEILQRHKQRSGMLDFTVQLIDSIATG